MDATRENPVGGDQDARWRGPSHRAPSFAGSVRAGPGNATPRREARVRRLPSNNSVRLPLFETVLNRITWRARSSAHPTDLQGCRSSTRPACRGHPRGPSARHRATSRSPMSRPAGSLGALISTLTCGIQRRSQPDEARPLRFRQTCNAIATHRRIGSSAFFQRHDAEVVATAAMFYLNTRRRTCTGTYSVCRCREACGTSSPIGSRGRGG